MEPIRVIASKWANEGFDSLSFVCFLVQFCSQFSLEHWTFAGGDGGGDRGWQTRQPDDVCTGLHEKQRQASKQTRREKSRETERREPKSID